MIAFSVGSRVRPALALLAIAVLASASAGAQTSTGNIRGTVTGTAGAPLPGAQVTARDVATNALRSTMTGASGFYYIAALRPARYEVTVRRIGFTPESRIVDVQIGATVDMAFHLRDQAVQLEAVTVLATTPSETRTSEIGTNISRQQIENLPTFERNVLDLAKLVPGISAQAVNNSDKFLAGGGQPPESVNIFVDGASYKNDVLRGGVVGQDASKGNPLPQGAIQEFRVLTQNYKAEYQKAASVVIAATTRSGTNQLEADLFAYGVGRGYVARDAVSVRNNSPRPEYKRLQAGGNIGGPIVRDRLFYFGTYEINFRDEPAYIRLGGDSSLAPAALRQELAAHEGQRAQEFREHLGLGKLTWIASDRNTLDASLSVRRDDDFRGFGGQTAFEAAENLRVRTTTGVVNFKTAGDRWINEAQASGQMFTWGNVARDFGLIGRNYFGLLRVGGKDAEQEFEQNRFSLRDDMTRTGWSFAGDHVLKAGVNVDFVSYRGTKYQSGNPVFNFRSNPENWSQPFEAFIGFGDPTIERDNTQFGVYIQDDWSIGSRLVLNLGLRWDGETNMINNDYVTPAPLADSLRMAYDAGVLVVDQPLPENQTQNVEVIRQLGGIERYLSDGESSRPMYKKAFQPRVGASFDLTGDGSTVLFGGAGLYFDRNYWNTLFDEQFRRQFQVIRIDFRDDCAGATNCAAWNPQYLDPAQLRALAVATGRPEVFLVANDMVPPRTVQMSAGVRRVMGEQRVTLSYNGLRGRNYMNFVRGSPFGGGGLPYNTVFVADDRVKTWYDAMQLQIDRPLTIGSRWGGGLAYTLSRSEEQGQSQDLFWGFDGRYPTVGDRPRLRAPGDQRHAVVMNGIVRLPFDMLFSTIINLGSGIAVNATDATAGFETGRQVTYTYQPPTRPFLGLGNAFGYQNMDVRLQKDFPLVTGQTAALVVDVFNAFNSRNFGCYETTIQPGGLGSSPNYGNANCAGLGRRLQVGLRYGLRPMGGGR
ncbi:MAG TPA: carboxypeptidase regulatory-like domain-containing protein [Gemmatimonadaceae bacterium]|nr:carboxypeptidase regulatory-like domain-containing protein [Gemmatimonadaceae bacterium]